MPHALIIHPWVTDFKLYDEWMHPLGLYFLVSLLRHNGFEVTYHTCLTRSRVKRWSTADFGQTTIPKPPIYRGIPRFYKRYGESPTDLASFLRDSPTPDVIFIGSGMTYWIEGLEETVEAVRKAFPTAPLIVGGSSAVLMPEILRRSLPKAQIFPSRLWDAEALASCGISPLSKLSLCDWSLLPAFEMIADLPHGPVLTSLGCPLHCSYCASGILQGPYRARPIDDVVAETEYLVTRRHVRDLAFYDDALLHQSEKHVLLLLDRLLTAGIRARFHAPNGLHVGGVTRECARMMKRAGFVSLRFGYETGDPRFGGHTSRKAGREVLAEKTAVLREAGFAGREIGIYVMAGIRGQRPEDVAAEVDYAFSLGVKACPVFLSPVPGTALFEEHARDHPEIRTDPLTHNDMYFVSQLEGWSQEEMGRIADFRLRIAE